MRINKHISFLLILPLVTLLSVSCQQTSENEALKKEVMDIHDDVMPEMDNLMKLKKALKQKLEETDSSEEEQITSLREAIDGLNEADEAMMNWMREYNAPDESMSEEEVQKYLESEKEKIKDVKKKMKESQSQAKELLESLNNQ